MTENETLGGYVESFGCPPAFAGSDAISYAAETFVEVDPNENDRHGAAVLFVRWSVDSKRPDGHLETAFLAHGKTGAEARAAVEKLTLHELKEHLDRLIEESKGRPAW